MKFFTLKIKSSLTLRITVSLALVSLLMQPYILVGSHTQILHTLVIFPYFYSGYPNSRYSDKTDHGQKGPDKTEHVSGQNGPRLRTKRTTFQEKKDQASGQKGPRFWKKRALFYLGQTGQCKKIDDVLQRSKESSQYCVSN